MNLEPKTYHSNGKLLLTAEYVVLDGAKALALPTNYGQSLAIETNKLNTFFWKSYNELNEVWFEDEFTFQNVSSKLEITSKNYNSVSKRLIEIFKAIKTLNPEFLKQQQNYTVTTHQNFNRLWGLGTSSTLINNLAQWANVDAYKLLELTFGGSGYDIACAMAKLGITYQLAEDNKRSVNAIDFNPVFKDQLHFVYLNQKQNSRDGIAQYKKNTSDLSLVITEINQITDAMIVCNSLSEFQVLIEQHERIISKIIKQKTVKDELFSDFEGSIKSLGAWGGDFILAASKTQPEAYFKAKGFNTIIPYADMIKNKKDFTVL